MMLRLLRLARTSLTTTLPKASVLERVDNQLSHHEGEVVTIFASSGTVHTNISITRFFAFVMTTFEQGFTFHLHLCPAPREWRDASVMHGADVYRMDNTITGAACVAVWRGSS